MRLTLGLLALLAGTPALSQNRTPFEGAMPDTVILDAGWQMTPGDGRCTLTHHGQGVGQELVILAAPRKDDVVLGIILPTKGAFTKPIQLTVVAQGNEAQQIGRVTFNPTTGVLGTLLLANWPADRLLPRLTHADRLNVYAPDQHLLRSVRLAGSADAVQALNRCRQVDEANPISTPEAAKTRAIDIGWVPDFDRTACRIKRMTAKGNELSIFYGRRDGLVLVYRAINGPHPSPGSKLTAQLSLWQLAPGSAVVSDQDNLPAVQMTMAARDQDPLLFGRVPTGLLDKLRSDHWNTIAFGTANSGPVDLDDTAHTGGSAAALDAMAKCISELA